MSYHEADETSQLHLLPPALLALIFALPLSHAQYPPPTTYQNILTSPSHPNVTVSYKQPVVGICTPAFTTQKQYTGYIGLPPYTLAPVQQNYSINTFFWFVEARQNPELAPLTIYFNGGPGTSSMFGLFNEVGPCEVVQMNDGSYGTQMRLWGWDRVSNILFIDQPDQVGFSYDTATNASFNLLTGTVFEPPTPDETLPDFMYLNGTFGTANTNAQTPYVSTANTTQIAAAATWHFLQTWLSTFKQYNPARRPNTTASATEPAGIHLFTESYGGKYGPAFAQYFQEQNQGIANGSLPSNTTLPIQLQSVGIMNGLIDDLIQDYYYPIFAYNNTYGIETITQTDELNGLNNYTNDCAPAIQACRSAGTDVYGDDISTNELCQSAVWTCNNITTLAIASGYDPYDIRRVYPNPEPPAAYQEYLNQASVLESIGAPVNYTETNPYVLEAFTSTGDSIRETTVQDLADLLNMGVRVALIYGDADYLCNWMGGEAVSFAIANAIPDASTTTTVVPAVVSDTPSYSSGFAAAGYADIVVNETYVGGAVRQFGNLSFSRVYDSGHFVPYFQAATAFQIFARVVFGTEISTGETVDLSTYSSSGPTNSTFSNSVPPVSSPTCWVRSWNSSCSGSDTNAMLAGDGFVDYGIYYQDSASVKLPTSSVTADMPGETMSSGKGSDAVMSADGSTVPLTGVYTATSTPTSTTSSASSGRYPPPLVQFSLGPIVITVLSIVFGASIMM